MSAAIMNPSGWSTRLERYERGKIMRWRNQPVYAFQLDQAAPLTFRDRAGTHWQPNRNFETDWGSIPSLAQAFLPRDECLGYLFHDSGYTHGGLHACDTLDGTYYFRSMTRRQLDDMLSEIVLIQWRDPIKARTVWGCVRAGGWISWRAHRKREDELERLWEER